MSRFNNIETLGICAENTSLFVNMLKTLKNQCKEDDEHELLEHVIQAIDHLTVIKNFFIDRQDKVFRSMCTRKVPVRVIGATNLRVVVDNTKKKGV